MIAQGQRHFDSVLDCDRRRDGQAYIFR